MTATATAKKTNKKTGSEALKRTKIKVRILGEEFDFKNEEHVVAKEEKRIKKETLKEEKENKEELKKEEEMKKKIEEEARKELEKRKIPKIVEEENNEEEQAEEEDDEDELVALGEASNEDNVEEDDNGKDLMKEAPAPRKGFFSKFSFGKKKKEEKLKDISSSKETGPDKDSKEALIKKTEEAFAITSKNTELASIDSQINSNNLVPIEDENSFDSEEEVKEANFTDIELQESEDDINNLKKTGKKNFLKNVGADDTKLKEETSEEKKEISFQKIKPVNNKKINKVLKINKKETKNKKADANTEEVGDIEEEHVRPRSIKLYRKISFFFAFLTIALLVAVFLLVFVSMTITVTPKSETINEKLIVNIFDKEKNQKSNFSQEAVAGEVVQVEVIKENEYGATGAEIISRDIKGKVKIINEYDYSQPLVAKTRLLTADDKLFRIIETVNIPAGGEVEVEIYTDDPSEEMAVAPTRFTIPGLPAFKQDKVYAVNDEKFIYETQIKKYVQQTDIDAGVSDLKELLKADVESQYGKEYKGNDKVIYEIDKNSIEIDLGAGVNEEADEFTIGISAIVNIVAFRSNEVHKIAEDRLVSIIPSNKKFLAINENDTEYTLSNYSFKQGVATVELSFSAEASLDEAKDVVDKKKLVGLNEDQIIKFLESEDKFDNFQIEFFPSFIKKAPQLVDRIKIQISK